MIAYVYMRFALFCLPKVLIDLQMEGGSANGYKRHFILTTNSVWLVEIAVTHLYLDLLT